MEHSDEQLLATYSKERGTRAGQDAATELTRRHEKWLITTLAWKLKGDKDKARDLAQETLLRVFMNAEKFNPETTTFKKYLFFVSYNIFIDEYRSRRAKPSRTNMLHAGDNPDFQTPDFEDIRHVSAETKVEQKEFKERFWTFVDGLPTTTRQAICLIVVDGLSYSQAAKTSGVLAPTLKKRVASVMDRLRQAIGDVPDNLAIELERRRVPRVAESNPFLAIESQAETFTLNQFIDTLTDEDFRICELVCYQGMSPDEASDIVGMTIRQVDKILDGVVMGLVRKVSSEMPHRLTAVA